jgi:hypothetical protein
MPPGLGASTNAIFGIPNTFPIPQQVPITTNMPSSSPTTLPTTTPTTPPPTVQNTSNTSTNTAASAAATKQAQGRAYLQDQADSTVGLENTAGDAAGTGYTGQGTSLYGTIAQGQNAVDQARRSIGVNQIQSINSLVDQIRNGIQGTRVTLGNSNALDSSAADAAARIYSNFGNTQRNIINNSAAVSNNAQDVAQNNLGVQKDVGITNLNAWKDQALSTISSDTQSKLLSLDGMAKLYGIDSPNGSPIGGVVDVQGLRNQVLQHAQDQIAAADKIVQDHLNSVHQLNPDEVASQAEGLVNAGTTSSSGSQPYNIGSSSNDPINVLGGATTSQLPLYLKPKSA